MSEHAFAEIYGADRLESLSEFIRIHDLTDQYLRIRDDPVELCTFGFQYGLVEIVAFCYCHLRIALDIRKVLDGHFKILNSTLLKDDERQITAFQVPLIYSKDSPDGLVITTLDEYTAGRRECLAYLTRMIRFSRYTITRRGREFQYAYRVVDKYIEPYQLLKV